jgi:four helix bundle protein
MQDFRELKVWQKSHSITLKIYEITKQYPTEEKYGLISQIRRASASIPTNIAEGCGRRGKAEFSRFIDIAFASACETQYLLILSKDLKYLSLDIYENLSLNLVEIKRMLTGLGKKLISEN